MVSFIGVPPVFDFTVLSFNNDNTFFRLTEGNDEEDSVF
jgi:hypothetical protein